MNRATALVLMVGLALLAACQQDDGSSAPGSFTYDGTTYELHQADMQDWGDAGVAGSYDIDVIVYHESMSHGVYLDLNSATPGDLDPATYAWSVIRDPHTLVDAAVGIGTWSVDAVGGSVTVTRSGDTYTISFSLDLNNGQTATGSYTGPLTKY